MLGAALTVAVGHHPARRRAARARRRLRQRQPVRQPRRAERRPSRARPSPRPGPGCAPCSPPDPVKPGSGQGVAKCFAYVKRTKGGGPVQVGKRWTAVAMIPEVDTLTAAGSMTGSSLWAELRSAWSDERVGHDYADATKSVVLQPRRYRLCMIVGVQPLRAGPLFDDVDAGTPQRFVWFPVDDPGAPEQRPDPAPTEAARMGRNWMDPSPPSPHYFADIDQSASTCSTSPSTAPRCVLTVPPEVTEIVDAVRARSCAAIPASTRSTGTSSCAS